ncbi:MAG: GAF domain-containing protein [Cyanobacteriota bacterium]|nr:GAF domain-containing protein [Cyanobacteriota bacterium]
MQPTGYFYNPDIWALSVVKCVHLLIEYGYTDEAPFGYTNYGLFLTITLEQYKTGYEFGCVGVQLVDKFHNLPQKSQVYCPFGMCLSPWVESSKLSQDFAMQAYYAGLEAGNLQWAGYSLGYRLFMLVFNGNNLQELLKEVEICFVFGKKQQNQVVVDMAISCYVILSQLSDYRGQEMGSEIDLIGESEILEHSTSIPQYLIFKSQLCYLQEQIEAALYYSLKAKEVVNLIQGNIPVVEYNFYYSLILLALHHTKSVEEKQDDWKQLIANQKQMKKWSDNCPENFLHRYLLVAAEMARLSDEKLKAIEMYDRAIAGAKEYKFIQNEALANELAAKFYLEWGKEKVAQTYMIEAYYCYSHWGAKAKVKDLEQRYPQLLVPILEQQKISQNPFRTIASLGKTSTHTQATINSNTTGISDALDFTSIIKASQALSSEIELNQLISQLMQVMMENAGATKGVLILSEVEQLTVQAISTNNSNDDETIHCTQQSIPVEESLAVPRSVINLVKRSLEPLNLDEVSSQTQFASDDYFIGYQPQSLLCLPLCSRGELIGILYLENDLTAGAFTEERVEVLNLLCSQAAISLEKAQLYQKSQEYAHQLEQSLTELQAAQVQLVQSEKMSALGEMMSGIAHEINNPVGFIGGNLSPAEDYVQDLIEHLSRSQINTPR